MCVCLCLCVCVCIPQISADQDQTDLRVSTWLLRGARVCDFTFVWTAMIPLINFINALQIPRATVTCAPEPITAELKPTIYLKKQANLYLQRHEVDRDFAGGSVPFCASKLTVVDQ